MPNSDPRTTQVPDTCADVYKRQVLYWAFAAALLGGALFMKKNLIRVLLAEQMELPDAAWNKLNWAWICLLYTSRCV